MTQSPPIASQPPFDAAQAELAEQAKSWPFAEARALRDRLEKLALPADQPVLFETGYGPSGLPHIGTFGEVVRTSMVRHAFAVLTGRPTRLVCFSDDLDGLRKVPDNVPNPDQLADYLDQPLTSVPDPFGTHDSFGFDYEFVSASERYRSGAFDDTLLAMLKNFEKIFRNSFRYPYRESCMKADNLDVRDFFYRIN